MDTVICRKQTTQCRRDPQPEQESEWSAEGVRDRESLLCPFRSVVSLGVAFTRAAPARRMAAVLALGAWRGDRWRSQCETNVRNVEEHAAVIGRMLRACQGCPGRMATSVSSLSSISSFSPPLSRCQISQRTGPRRQDAPPSSQCSFFARRSFLRRYRNRRLLRQNGCWPVRITQADKGTCRPIRIVQGSPRLEG